MTYQVALPSASPIFQPPRRWMAAVELVLFISMGGYFTLSLLSMAALY
jgi:hypothetical protein